MRSAGRRSWKHSARVFTSACWRLLRWCAAHISTPLKRWRGSRRPAPPSTRRVAAGRLSGHASSLTRKRARSPCSAPETPATRAASRRAARWARFTGVRPGPRLAGVAPPGGSGWHRARASDARAVSADQLSRAKTLAYQAELLRSRASVLSGQPPQRAYAGSWHISKIIYSTQLQAWERYARGLRACWRQSSQRLVEARQTSEVLKAQLQSIRMLLEQCERQTRRGTRRIGSAQHGNPSLLQPNPHRVALTPSGEPLRPWVANLSPIAARPVDPRPHVPHPAVATTTNARTCLRVQAINATPRLL